MFNYCFDACPHNHVSRRSIEDGINDKGNPKRITQATEGKNLKPKCELGYVVTVNSKEALKNAIKNNGQVCRFLKQVFK